MTHHLTARLNRQDSEGEFSACHPRRNVLGHPLCYREQDNRVSKLATSQPDDAAGAVSRVVVALPTNLREAR